MTEYLIKIKVEDVDSAVDKARKAPLDFIFRRYSQIAKFEGKQNIDGEIYLVHVFTDITQAFNFGNDLMKERHEIISESRKSKLNGTTD